jgi:hypothetical protein
MPKYTASRLPVKTLDLTPEKIDAALRRAAQKYIVETETKVLPIVRTADVRMAMEIERRITSVKEAA